MAISRNTGKELILYGYLTQAYYLQFQRKKFQIIKKRVYRSSLINIEKKEIKFLLIMKQKLRQAYTLVEKERQEKER